MSVESGYAASQKGKLNQHVEAVHKLIRIRILGTLSVKSMGELIHRKVAWSCTLNNSI